MKTKAETKKRGVPAPKTPEAMARKKAVQFGQPNGNPTNGGWAANSQRAFYRWVEAEASEEELKAYAADESKPIIRRNFVKAMLKCKDVDDYFAMTNQTHGAPKQTIEQTTLPDIAIILE